MINKRVLPTLDIDFIQQHLEDGLHRIQKVVKMNPIYMPMSKKNPLRNANIYGLCCAVHRKCETIRNWEARQGINDSNNSSVTETSSRLGHHIRKDIVGENFYNRKRF